ncbi:MAG TPA: phosphocarrier protein HPr [Bacillota bacterium]|nr:phosphocarrier protein HPr [Bacillota bacterium]
MAEKIFLITVDTGVHARPATLLVNKASQYSSAVELHYKEKSVNLKSIMGVMSLGIPQGAEVKVTTEGNDEEDAIEGITVLIEEHLGEIKE